MGRGKVELKRIENPTSRQVTFSKRKNGLIKKAFELSVLCDAEVALAIFSSSGKAYNFASHDMHRTVSRYRQEIGMPHSIVSSLGTMETWRSEMEELRRTVGNLETRLKHLAGEDLSSLGMKELKQLERQLNTGVQRIHSRKRRLVSENANMLRRRLRALQEDNTRLHKRLKELDSLNASSNNLTPVWPHDAFQRIAEDEARL